MSNWNIEKYLEAIIAGIASGEKTDVPVPSWNIEKYLAAIIGAVYEQNTPMEAKTETDVKLLSYVADDSTNFAQITVGNITKCLYSYGIDVTIPDDAYATINDTGHYDVVYEDGNVIIEVGAIVQGEARGITKWSDLNGKQINIIGDKTSYPPNVINLYDPNDPNEDGSYSPEYATYEDGTYTLDSTYDAAPAYERLRRGLPVWLRVPPNDAPDNTNGLMYLVDSWYFSDDNVTLTMYNREFIVTTENYRPEDGE